MDVLANLMAGLETALSPGNIMFCFLGVFLGTFIGVLPGIGALAAVSMLLPITFYLPPETGVIMLAGVYYGAEYGGSTASILLNLPGTPSSAVTALDGYPMAQKGKAAIALFTTTIASFVGGTIGIVVLMFLAPLLAQWALSFGSPDYVSLMLLGLLAAAATNQGAAIKGVLMVSLGVLLGCVGTDLDTGDYRFTLNFLELADGISLVAMAMGLFGLSEVVRSIVQRPKTGSERIRLRDMIPPREEARRAGLPILRGAGMGVSLGPLPGTGPTLSAFLAYAVEKKISRKPEKFGTGTIEGIAAPEAANNAAAQTAFIPTLTLGIPGSPTMALILGALLIHGITPGPTLISYQPQVFWGLVASFWLGNLFLLLLNIPLIGIWVRLLSVPYNLLYPVILGLICVGVYSVSNSAFDVGVTVAFGIFGYLLRLAGFEPAPLLIGFVIGPMLEEHLRRALSLSGGDWSVFVTEPISGSVLAITAVLLLFSGWTTIRKARGRKTNSAGSSA